MRSHFFKDLTGRFWHLVGKNKDDNYTMVHNEEMSGANVSQRSLINLSKKVYFDLLLSNKVQWKKQELNREPSKSFNFLESQVLPLLNGKNTSTYLQALVEAK